MVNAGCRDFAIGGPTANNTTNTLQGWESIGSSKPRVMYLAAAHVDPGATGNPPTVTSGSAVKLVSRLTVLPNGAENRPSGLDMVVLTVAESIPAADAIRSGASRVGNKASPCRLSDINLGALQNFPSTQAHRITRPHWAG